MLERWIAAWDCLQYQVERAVHGHRAGVDLGPPALSIDNGAIDNGARAVCDFPLRCNRQALAVTESELSTIAAAASAGDTAPLTAKGNANRL